MDSRPSKKADIIEASIQTQISIIFITICVGVSSNAANL